MNNRNKKTLINAIIGIFSIALLVGAAFAFAPGVLDVRGTVNIAVPEYVVWTNVEGGPGFIFGPGVTPSNPTVTPSTPTAAPSTPTVTPSTSTYPATAPPETVPVTYPPEPTGPEIIPDPAFVGFAPLGGESGATHSAEIVDARGQTNQRIEWNINFYQGGFADITATVTNQSALHDAVITYMNISWFDEDMANIFGDSLTVRNFTDSFVGTILAPGGSTSVVLAVDWDGTVPDGFVASNDGYTFVNTFFIEFGYELAH